ncbi:uncharacterized protein LOC135385061 [Ornithodoros turicata]|uniref:uncharacterized protein LOC135385061 n=1 Tax=Ornithodoros turicata TaxID=34597 RepID=UPI003138B6EA
MYKNDRSVKNSAEFCELIRDIRIDDGDVMMSFDVISLFTNVPIDVALSVVRTKLRADVDLEDRTDLSVEDILELLKLCLGQTFLQFKNRFFKQTDGCPMGSPISTTIANLVMEFVEDKALEDAGQFITFYRRYVDDTFVIIKKNFTNTFFDKLNSIHPNIQFTCEEEKEKKIAFLDVLVQRDPCGNLKTSVYRKPCDTSQVLHYGSGHPLEHKRSVVRSLLSRAMKIPSDHQTRHEEITKAKADLRRRAYPEQFICDTYHRMMNTRPEQAESSQERPMYVTIPYLKGVSEPIRRLLSEVRLEKIIVDCTSFSVTLLQLNGIVCQSLEEQANALGEHVFSSSRYSRDFLKIKLSAEEQTIPSGGCEEYSYNSLFTMTEL